MIDKINHIHTDKSFSWLSINRLKQLMATACTVLVTLYQDFDPHLKTRAKIYLLVIKIKKGPSAYSELGNREYKPKIFIQLLYTKIA